MALDKIPAGGFPPFFNNRPGAFARGSVASGIAPQAEAAPFALEAATAGAGVPSLNNQQAGSALAEAASMQPNQVFISRQLIWQNQDGATLAASWQTMVQTYGEQRTALLDQTRGLHVPAGRFMVEQDAVALRANISMMELEPWRFAVLGWGGQRMTLRVLARASRKRWRAKVALRLELALPDSSFVMVQMEAVGDGIFLDLAGINTATLQQALPALAEAIAQAGLRIARCRMQREPHPIRVRDMQTASAAPSLAVFEAMAAVALLLSQPPAWEADDQPTVPMMLTSRFSGISL